MTFPAFHSAKNYTKRVNFLTQNSHKSSLCSTILTPSANITGIPEATNFSLFEAARN